MRGFKIFRVVMALSLVAMVGIVSSPAPAVAQGESMLYLVEFKANEAGVPSNPEQAIELLEQLIVPSLESLAADTKIRAGGLLVGSRAGVFLVAAKSHDEVTELVRALPAWGVWGWKVTPLESFTHRAELEKQVIKGLSSASP